MRGKGHYWIPESKLEKDHPRLCGEKRNFELTSWSTAGSPPPMRGKGLLNHVRSIDVRITPAYAGKS